MKLLYEKETYNIRGACFWVWKEFGSSFKESIIEKALVEELKQRGFKVDQQKRIKIYYKEVNVGTYVPDIIVDDIILIELKCKQFLAKEDELQFWRYLKGSKYTLGLLINFGKSGLEIRRRIHYKEK